MSTSTPSLPDFSPHGYRIERQLSWSGRVTYLAQATASQQLVVIKQFQFAQVSAQWSDYEAHERETRILKALDHPAIPAYLDIFETETGVCLVQEYKAAVPLATVSDLTVAEIWQVAISILEILAYLQQQTPPIVHCNITPDNILVDQQLRVYLVGFGLAHNIQEEPAIGNITGEPLGFMPPEQLLNQPLTLAADVYGVGATLMYLFSQPPSTAANPLLDPTKSINVRQRLPHLDPHRRRWLELMVVPDVKKRYVNAAEALSALHALETKRHPLALKQRAAVLGGLVAAALVGVYSPALFSPAPVTPLARLQNTQSCVGCDLSGVNLKGVDLRSMDLTGANLTGADLRQADLRGAYLARANLTSAHVEGAIFASTDLRGAILPDGSVHP